MFAVGRALTSNFPQALLTGIAFWILFAAFFAGLTAFVASWRRPLVRPQNAPGLRKWRYLDFAAPYQVVFNACADIMHAFCKTEPVVRDFQSGVLSGETRPSIWSWGSEISLWVEALGESHTRVQVLSRPIVPTNVADFGANERNFNRVVEMLRIRLTVVAEG
jgi:hypothetical protein